MWIADGAEKGPGFRRDHVACHKNNAPCQFRVFLLNTFVKLPPVHEGHAKIGEDHVEGVFLQQFQGLQSRAAGHRLVPEQ